MRRSVKHCTYRVNAFHVSQTDFPRHQQLHERTGLSPLTPDNPCARKCVAHVMGSITMEQTGEIMNGNADFGSVVLDCSGQISG